MRRHLLALLLLPMLWACSRNDDTSVPARVVPVYRIMAAYADIDSAAQDSVFRADSVEIEAFMRTVSELPCDRELIAGWSASQVVEVFTPDVDSVFADTSSVAKSLGRILARAGEQGLNLPNRRYAAVVYGRPESILFVDSVMLIALNHYLGADYPGYSHWPAYMRAQKTPASLPCDIAEALTATSYPYEAAGTDATLASRLLYEGALAHAKTLLTGCTPAQALGYTDDEYRQLLADEAVLWHALIGADLLYDTSPAVADRLVTPAPRASINGTPAPGRVGRFIGYRIVQSYLSSHPTELAILLTPPFYTSPATLPSSAYNPG